MYAMSFYSVKILASWRHLWNSSIVLYNNNIDNTGHISANWTSVRLFHIDTWQAVLSTALPFQLQSTMAELHNWSLFSSG